MILQLLRRKAVSIPLALVLVIFGGLALTHYRLMSDEAFVYEIGSSIRGRLGDFSKDFQKGDPKKIAAYFAPEFRGGELGFAKRQVVSDEGGIVLEDWQAAPEVELDRQKALDQLMAYRAKLHGAEMTKFKMVFLNEYDENTANILIRFQVYARDDQGHRTEDRGHITMDLVRQQGDWLIATQELVSGRRVIGMDSAYFVDVTDEVGLDFNTGQNPIFQFIKHNFAIVDRAAGGVTSGDFDKDGYPDLFLSGFAQSKLFRNTGKGGFEDVTSTAFSPEDMEKIQFSQGCLFADYDNDGNLDIFITKTPKIDRSYFLEDWPLDSASELLAFFEASPVNAFRVAELFERSQDAVERLLKESPDEFPQLVDELVERWEQRLSNRLMRNNGDGTFSDVTDAAGLRFNSYCTTAGFADIDTDGDLDLYVGVYGPARQASPDPPFHERYGLPNLLYRNNGDGTFSDISAEAQVDDTGWTLGMTFMDYDNDGDQDIYVANDFGYNNLFQNDGTGHFKDVAKESKALDYGFGMSPSPGDFDNDGDLDIYVSNIYSGTTWYIQHTIMQFLWVRFIDPARTLRSLGVAAETYHFMDGLAGIYQIGKKFGEGNSLLENQGDGTFKSVGAKKGVNMAGWAWGSNFFDFDNDGDQDIHCANGWITGSIKDDL